MDAGIISIGSDVVVGLSAITVAIMAVIGIKTWRKEMTGRAKFEVSRNLMKSSMHFKKYFESSRSIFTSASESIGRSKSPSETANETSNLNEWYARTKRLERVGEELIAIQEASWEADILFEEETTKTVEQVVTTYRSSYAELSSAITSYFDTRVNESKTNTLYKNQEWLTSLHKTIYSQGDDDLQTQIDDVTNQLKMALKSYVK